MAAAKPGKADAQLARFAADVVRSRTMWAALVLPLVVALIPPAAPWIALNPEAASWIVGGLFAGLRLVTEKPLAPKPKKLSIAPKPTPQPSAPQSK